ncbi:hypothetical protein LTR62_005113 [Meristemomyces frigidus]|uniref:Uncharacterized protein n=1 Tax=Meristemomyces frigidus TaxID=1508187 RepID=A0AAN7YJF7_9PEZI|nr:hypothetical protein LTR62_005113 [Meristemomyces frigidus]
MATSAPIKSRLAQLNIPPPPLPEFYLPKNGGDNESTSADGDRVRTKTKLRFKHGFTTIDETEPAKSLVKVPTPSEDAIDERMTRVQYPNQMRYGPLITMPAPPGGAGGVPPLAIYHICRLCLRPRSARYHREHPIPINGMPPPPGICRRCRVITVESESVEEVTTTKARKIEQIGESNETRIGLGCLVRDEDYVSNQGFEDLHGRKFMPPFAHLGLRRSTHAMEGEDRETFSYRHVRIRESSMSRSPPRPRTHAESTAQDVIDAVSERDTTSVKVAYKAEAIQPKTRMSSYTGEARRMGVYSGFREVGSGVVVDRTSSTAKRVQNSTQMATPATSVVSVAASVQSTHKSVAQASAVVTHRAEPSLSESTVRKLAREEVERYRQAERKLEAHRNPYAHGRVVPVEKRIERQADDDAPPPWATKQDVDEEVVMMKQPRRQEQSCSKSTSWMPEPRSEPPRPGKDTATKSRQGCDDESMKSKSEAARHSQEPRKKASEWAAEEIVVECVRQPATRTTASDYKPNRGKTAGTRTTEYTSPHDEPRNDRVCKLVDSALGTNTTEHRSEHSERRKWDNMAESVEPTPKQRFNADHFADGCQPRREEYVRREIWLSPVEEGVVRREVWLPDGADYDVIEVVKDDYAPPIRRGNQSMNGRAKTGMPAETPEQPGQVESKASNVADTESPRTRATFPEKAAPDQQRCEQKEVPARWDERDILDIKYRKRETHEEETKRGPASLSSRFKQASVEDAEDSISDKQNGEATPKPRPRAYNLRMATVEKLAQAHKRRVQEDDEKTMHPNAFSNETQAEHNPGLRSESTKTEREPSRQTKPKTTPSQTSHKPKPPEQEYIYTKRTVEPVRSRIRHDGSRDIEGSRYMRTEEIWRQSNGARLGSRTSHNNKIETPSTKAQAKGAEGSVTSSRVRFASKIEISPTPPESEASSSEFRIIGSKAGSKKKLRDGESAEDLIAEFESRGRSRTRGSASPGSRASKEDRDTTYYYERKETSPAVDGAWEEGGQCMHWNEESSIKSQSKQSQTPYSESPSREKFMQVEEEKEDEWASYRYGTPRRESTGAVVDGTGSGHGGGGDGGVGEDRRFGHAHGRSPETLSVPEGHVHHGW